MPKLVEFKTDDGLRLPGLLYTPDKPTDKVAIFLHGCGSSSVFYSVEKMNLFAKYFNENNIAFLPFNNRGAHIIKRLNKEIDGVEERLNYGTAYEKIADCIFDIDAAINFLKNEGFKEFYLIGSSTGANKICVYNYYKPENEVSKYILLAGGDDTGIYFSQLGKDRFELALAKCRFELAKGNGKKLMPKYLIGDMIYSIEAFYDVINPDGDYNVFPYTEYEEMLELSTKELFREFASIAKPTLVVYGEFDEYVFVGITRAFEILKSKIQQKQKHFFKFNTIKDTGHGFDGKSEELAKIMGEYLNS